MVSLVNGTLLRVTAFELKRLHDSWSLLRLSPWLLRRLCDRIMNIKSGRELDGLLRLKMVDLLARGEDPVHIRLLLLNLPGTLLRSQVTQRLDGCLVLLRDR